MKLLLGILTFGILLSSPIMASDDLQKAATANNVFGTRFYQAIRSTENNTEQNRFISRRYQVTWRFRCWPMELETRLNGPSLKR